MSLVLVGNERADSFPGECFLCMFVWASVWDRLSKLGKCQQHKLSSGNQLDYRVGLSRAADNHVSGKLRDILLEQAAVKKAILSELTDWLVSY